MTQTSPSPSTPVHDDDLPAWLSLQQRWWAEWCEAQQLWSSWWWTQWAPLSWPASLAGMAGTPPRDGGGPAATPPPA